MTGTQREETQKLFDIVRKCKKHLSDINYNAKDGKYTPEGLESRWIHLLQVEDKLNDLV